MSEKSMRDTMRSHFKDEFGYKCHWQRIEDSVGVGIPDIYVCANGIRFWIEAKQMDQENLPKRDATPVRIGLKPEQALWLNEEKIASGNALVIAKIGREWFVFNDHFTDLVKGMSLAQLRLNAASNWVGSFDTHRVINVVCS